MDLIKEGQTINGKYQVIEKIGEGATAHVYLAYNLIDEINVSLKILKTDNLTEKKIKDFKKEAHAISLLNHENIIKIYEISPYKETYYIAQEYIEGMSLKEYIENTSSIPTTKAVDIIIKVLEGLSHAHEKRVIHKDIKSQNILLGVDQEIKITDFGIADVLEDDMTKTQSLMGTPQYVAPEVLNKGYSTHQTDIYSTGILLYELLIGYAPFYGEKPTVIILKQLNQPIPSVKQQRDEIPQSLENIVIKATAKKLMNRYKTADEMIEDLRTCFNISRINEKPLELKNDFEFQDFQSINLSKIKEEEALNEKKQKKGNYLILLAVLLGFLFLIVFINLIVFFNAEDQKMPDLVEMNYVEAITSLETFNVDKEDVEIKYEDSQKYDKDIIISTDPVSGEVIGDNPIILTVSNGIEEVEVGNYVGLYKEDAQKAIENLGLKVEFFYEESEQEAGKVIKQIPESKTKVLPGDTVNLIISNGLKEFKIEELVGKTEDDFDKYIEDKDLNSSKEYVCSDTIEENKIIEQDPLKDTKIEKNSTVTVKISTGACGSSEDNTTNDGSDTGEDKSGINSSSIDSNTNNTNQSSGSETNDQPFVIVS